MMIEKKEIKKNNRTVALHFFYVKKEKTYPAYVSKYKSNGEKQVILLMIPKREGWHYLAVKKLLTILREITSKHHGHLHCLNWLHFFETENKFESHKKIC